MVHLIHPKSDFGRSLASAKRQAKWASFMVLERHVITHMVAGRCHLQEEHSHPGYVLNSLLTDLAQTIVQNVLFPATSAFMRPTLPPRVATVEFWQVLQAEVALVTGGSAEGIAGDQLCQWNTIAPDAIIPSTHLTLFLPPSLGAYVMANHQSHREFKPHPSSSTSDIPTFTVQQWLHFPLPGVLKNQVELLKMARYAAADGYITPAAIPFLSHSLTNEDMTFQKIKWSLRFPLPTPDPADPSRRFSSTPSFHNSPSSGEALEGAIRVAASFNYLSPTTTLLPTSEFLRLPDVFSVIGVFFSPSHPLISSSLCTSQPQWSLSHYFGHDPSHSMHLANEFGLTALASVSSSRPPQLGICCCR